MLAVERLSLRFGGLIATDNVDFAVAEGECRAIIGPNGAGKSTLIAQLAGERKPDSGRIFLAGEDVTRLGPFWRARRGLGRSFQITSVFQDLTALENVALAVQARASADMRFWRAAARQDELVGPATETLRHVGLGRRMDARVATLAHGEKRALEVAIALAARPSLLLLDEPLAGMGPEEGVRMVELLKTLKRSVTILLIEHDMDAVFALADQVSVLVYGRLIATGSPADIRADAEVRRAYLGEDH